MSEEVKKHLYDIHDVYLPSDDEMDGSDYEEDPQLSNRELAKIRRNEKLKVLTANKSIKRKYE